MKKLLLIFVAPILLFGCEDNDTHEDTDETVAIVETPNDALVVDYSTMTYAEQEEDMNQRLTAYRNAEDKVEEANRDKYRTRVDNLENDITVYRTKRAEYDRNPDNEELKSEMEKLGDRIRETTDDINDEFKSIGKTLKDHHNQKVEDVKKAAESLRAD